LRGSICWYKNKFKTSEFSHSVFEVFALLAPDEAGVVVDVVVVSVANEDFGLGGSDVAMILNEG
jgi:hypothetical protein